MKYDVLNRFINLDETHHPFSTNGDKGGPRGTTYTNPDFNRSGSRIGQDGNSHTTGVYALSPLEPFPPIFIFEIGAKNAEGMRIKTGWLTNLPTVVEKWGFDEVTSVNSHVVVRKKVSMDEELFRLTISFIASLYPHVSPKVERDKEGKFMRGPIIIKMDSGPGRNCKSWVSVKF